MTEETNVSPAEETENQSAELTQETPEVVTPENVEQTESESAEQEPSQEDEREKALKRMQRRIDRRTAELYRERAEAEQLRQRLSQLETPKEEGEQTKVDPIQLAREIAAAERFNEKCNAIANEGAKKFKDFDVALKSVAAEVGPLFDQRGKPTPLMQEVAESDSPAALLHYLGTNPDVAAELADLNSSQLARRLVRIEREMTEASKPKVSKAPTPLTPVKGSGTAVKDPSQMTDAEYRAWRLSQK